MRILVDRNKVGLGLVAVLAMTAVPLASFATDETVTGKMSTADTQDIINTLRKEGKFHRMLDGLQISFDMDNKLKGKGPFTVFAADDKAWAKINQADQDTLFGNKNKLQQVFKYQIVDNSRISSEMLKTLTSVKSSEGHDIKISLKDNADAKDGEQDLFVDRAKVKTKDIQCSNGVIHVVDQPIMPPLAQ